MEGRATGIEMWGNFQASEKWRLSAGMTALHERFTLKPESIETSNVVAASGRDPTYTAMLRSSFDIDPRNEFDLMIRRVAKLSSPEVPAYTAVDMRYAWTPRKNLELSITGRDLFGSHAEFSPSATRSSFGRGILLKLVAGF